MNTTLAIPGPDELLERPQAIDFIVRRIAPELYTFKSNKYALQEEKSKVRKRIDYACDRQDPPRLRRDARKRIVFRDLLEWARTIPEWKRAMRDLPIHAITSAVGASATFGAGAAVRVALKPAGVSVDGVVGYEGVLGFVGVVGVLGFVGVVGVVGRLVVESSLPPPPPQEAMPAATNRAMTNDRMRLIGDD